MVGHRIRFDLQRIVDRTDLELRQNPSVTLARRALALHHLIRLRLQWRRIGVDSAGAGRLAAHDAIRHRIRFDLQRIIDRADFELRLDASPTIARGAFAPYRAIRLRLQRIGVEPARVDRLALNGAIGHRIRCNLQRIVDRAGLELRLERPLGVTGIALALHEFGGRGIREETGRRRHVRGKERLRRVAGRILRRGMRVHADLRTASSGRETTSADPRSA
ncbi:MAG: hypothetical protein J0H86_00725 [Xanthomonadaceae bacterium]|nr:hypothetical protein [Xanthomonadaceae bacterium]